MQQAAGKDPRLLAVSPLLLAHRPLPTITCSDLSECQLAEIPPELGGLTRLQVCVLTRRTR